ncbi:threonine/serine dehydratase [Alphaproteobacteria bacterium]|nr:threonine/serine dehydratase [Alphaproteobacteria bacterium]
MILPTYSDLEAAVERTAPHIVQTPLLESPLLNQLVGGRVLVKAEPLQKTGSFKFRGASNAIWNLPDHVTHVVAYSSGNHAAAVAAAATSRGMVATIIMPEDAPAMKVANTKAFGGQVVTFNRYTENREAIGAELAKTQGATLIPPYEYLPVIAGQGTIGIEIANHLTEQNIIPDQLICCTGGGGLIAGISIGIHQHFPDLDIIAAEPEGFDDFKRSLELGERVSNDPDARSICDAIITPIPGEMTFAINKAHVKSAAVVSDDEALMAVATAWQYLKCVAEPGGAVALAAILSGKVEARNKTSIVIVSGGNIDQAMFTRALNML